MLFRKRMFLKNIIKSLYKTITNNHNTKEMQSAAPFVEHKQRDPYIASVANEYGVAYDSDLSRVWINSSTGRVETLENVQKILSEIHKCGPILFDRFAKHWFFGVMDV